MTCVFIHNSKKGMPVIKKFLSEFLCLCSLGYKHTRKAKASSISTWDLKALAAVNSAEALGVTLSLLQVQELCWCWGWHVLRSRLLASQYWVWSLWELQVSCSSRFWHFPVGSTLVTQGLEDFQSPGSQKPPCSMAGWTCRNLGPSQEPARPWLVPCQCTDESLLNQWHSCKTFQLRQIVIFSLVRKFLNSSIYERLVSIFGFLWVYDSNEGFVE